MDSTSPSTPLSANRRTFPKEELSWLSSAKSSVKAFLSPNICHIGDENASPIRRRKSIRKLFGTVRPSTASPSKNIHSNDVFTPYTSKVARRKSFGDIIHATMKISVPIHRVLANPNSPKPCCVSTASPPTPDDYLCDLIRSMEMDIRRGSPEPQKKSPESKRLPSDEKLGDEGVWKIIAEGARLMNKVKPYKRMMDIPSHEDLLNQYLEQSVGLRTPLEGSKRKVRPSSQKSRHVSTAQVYVRFPNHSNELEVYESQEKAMADLYERSGGLASHCTWDPDSRVIETFPAGTLPAVADLWLPLESWYPNPSETPFSNTEPFRTSTQSSDAVLSVDEFGLDFEPDPEMEHSFRSNGPSKTSLIDKISEPVFPRWKMVFDTIAETKSTIETPEFDMEECLRTIALEDHPLKSSRRLRGSGFKNTLNTSSCSGFRFTDYGHLFEIGGSEVVDRLGPISDDDELPDRSFCKTPNRSSALGYLLSDLNLRPVTSLIDLFEAHSLMPASSRFNRFTPPRLRRPIANAESANAFDARYPRLLSDSDWEAEMISRPPSCLSTAGTEVDEKFGTPLKRFSCPLFEGVEDE